MNAWFWDFTRTWSIMVRESGLGGEARHSAAEVAVDLHDVLDGGGPKERGLDMLLDGTPVVVNPCIVGLHSIIGMFYPCCIIGLSWGP